MDLPSETESEQQVLGSLLLAPGLYTEVSGIVSAEDFYASKHRTAYELLVELNAEGTPVDPIIFNQRLPFRSEDAMFVARLLESVVAPQGAGYHATRVRDASRLRRLAIAGRDLAEAACAPGAKLEPVLTQAEHAVYAASQAASSSISWSESLMRTVDRIEHHYQSGSTMDGLATGIHAIDELLGGLQPGWLTYIGARPGVGKTALALQMATDIAREGHRVMFCSLEMSSEQLSQRALCRLAGISYSKVRNNQMTAADWGKFMHAHESLQSLPMEVFDQEVDTVSAIASRVRRDKPELLVIDYVQLMRWDGAKNRNEEVGLISRGLKLLARETEMPIVAPVQLNRAAVDREGGRPGLTDLRESGSLEQDADVVILLSRKTDQGFDGTTTNLDLAKFRHGPTGTASLGWDPTLTKFYDLY